MIGPVTRTVYYTATSLDGFIATADNSLDWLLSRDVDAAGPMGYDGFIAGVGAIAMGATTYLWVREHDPDWMPERPAWVFTHRNLSPIPGAPLTFDSSAGSWNEVIQASEQSELRRRGLVFGRRIAVTRARAQA